ncbi:hypothetical protein GCM10009648_22180 [Tsukamurella spumae]
MFGKRGTGTKLRLPGTSVTAELDRDTRSAGGHMFALVSVPSTADHTVVLDVWPIQSGIAPDAAVWCDRWREKIALVEDAPDVTAMTSVWDRTGERITNRLAVTFRAATKAHRELAEHAVEVGVRLPWLLSSLAEVGLDALPLVGEQITDWVTDCYSGEQVEDPRSWGKCGPVDSTQARDWYSHDGLVSASWIHQPPQTVSRPVLEHLISRTGGDRVRVAATYRPVGGEKNLLQRYFLSTTITNNGVEPGGGLVRQDLPLQARVAARRACDRHAEVFANSLGIGIVLPEHGSVAEHPTRTYREGISA